MEIFISGNTIGGYRGIGSGEPCEGWIGDRGDRFLAARRGPKMGDLPPRVIFTNKTLLLNYYLIIILIINLYFND